MQAEKLLNSLTRFRATANDEAFRGIFGEDLGDHLWGEFKRVDFDLIRFYGMLDSKNAALFGATFEAEGMFYTEPVCVECGAALSGEDVAAGEEICLECGAALLLDEANPLLATIFVSM